VAVHQGTHRRGIFCGLAYRPVPLHVRPAGQLRPQRYYALLGSRRSCLLQPKGCRRGNEEEVIPRRFVNPRSGSLGCGDRCSQHLITGLARVKTCRSGKINLLPIFSGFKELNFEKTAQLKNCSEKVLLKLNCPHCEKQIVPRLCSGQLASRNNSAMRSAGALP